MSVADGITELEAWADEFCAQHLDDYVKRLGQSKMHWTAREFNDPVWATISATPFEGVIIDSPLFQRLRRIRQLGVVHWVYPGAVHTRFEHSLGVLHQVQEIADSVNRASPRRPALDVKQMALLRFSALCHDLGHGSMSHVVENAVSRFDSIDELLLDFADQHDIEKPSLSEVVAYYMIGSPSFAALFELARKHAQGDLPPSDAINLTRHIIVGKTVDPHVPLLHRLISGPYDADKLDYMQRDALQSGVPAITDVPRLVRKIRSVWCEEKNLPEKLASNVTAGQGSYLLFGIAFSGSRTLDELLIARVLLFDKVYRHQKVRAIEGMVARLLQAMAKAYRGPLFRLPYLFVDELLIEADHLFNAIPGSDLPNHPVEAKIIEDLCSRLRERRLFVRAFVFGTHFKELERDPVGAAGMKLLKQQTEGAFQETVLIRVAAEVSAVLKLLGEAELLKSLPDQSLHSYFWIDPPNSTDHGKKIGHAFLIKENGDIIGYSEHSTEVSHWSQGYLAKKDVGYIFSIPELKEVVFLACEKMVGTADYNLRVPASSLDYLKLDIEELASKRRRLREGGYYSDVPFRSRPIPERLLRADCARIFREVSDSLRGHSPPEELADIATKRDIDPDRVALWCSQYESTDMIDVALAAVRKIKLYDRTDYVNALLAFRRSNTDFADAVLCPLGDAKDSGQIVAYLGGSVIVPQSLDVALQSGRPIVFVDDFIGSGSQVLTILADWFSSEDRPLAEASRKALTTIQQQQIRDVPLAFVFAAGWMGGATKLRATCQETGLKETIFVQFADGAIPSILNQGLDDYPGFDKFVDHSRKTAEALLRLDHPDWSEEILEQRLLGYGNQGLLITFPFNTPSQTLTTLWAGGRVEGLQWTPLLPRRPKK